LGRKIHVENDGEKVKTAKTTILASILFLSFLASAILILQTAVAEEWTTESIDTDGDADPDLDVRRRNGEVHVDLDRDGVIDEGEPYRQGVDEVHIFKGIGVIIRITYVWDPEAGEEQVIETFRAKNKNGDGDTEDEGEFEQITLESNASTELLDSTNDLVQPYTGEPATEYLDFVDTEIVDLQLVGRIQELDCTITVRQAPPINLTNTVFYTLMLDEDNMPDDNSMDFPYNGTDTMYTVIYTEAGGWEIERAVHDGYWMVEDTNARFGLASSLPGGFSVSMWIPLTELPEFNEVLPWKVKTETFNGDLIGDFAPDEGLAYLVYIEGDLNRDEIVDIFDVVNIAISFGTQPGDSSWNQVADLNYDDIVDIFDVVLLANNFGRTI